MTGKRPTIVQDVTLDNVDLETLRDSQTIRDLEAQQDQSLAKAYRLRHEIQKLVWRDEQYGFEEKLEAADRRERYQTTMLVGLIALYLFGQFAKILL